MKRKLNTISNHIDIHWHLGDSGTLSVAGTGKIPDYACGKRPPAPWQDVKEQIQEIHIAEGITEIGVNAFRECRNLRRVVLPDSLERIHAYAFYNCSNLTEIETNGTDFRYIYDSSRYKKEKTILFGVESFYNIPWAQNKWGDFYIQNEKLHTCFSNETSLVIPEGIRVLASFSLMNQKMDSVKLPESLERIEDFAFVNSSIKKNLHVPDSIQETEKYAFVGCSVPAISLPTDRKIEELELQRMLLKATRRKKPPEFINKYSVALKKDRQMGKFRKMQVVENKPVLHRDGTVTKVRDKNFINVGMSMFRRIRGGKTLLCITHEQGRVISVKSFRWDDYYELPEEYLMYPVIKENGGISIWSDSFTYQEKDDIVWAFDDRNGKELKEKGVLRLRHPDTHEEWFWYKNSTDFGGLLELELLQLWLQKNPEISVDSMEENMEKSKYRWFVSV